MRFLTAMVATLCLVGSGLAGAVAAGASTAVVAAQPKCTQTVTGTHHGDLTAASGVLCLKKATVDGTVQLSSGGALRADSATITGALTATGASSLRVCGTTLFGGLTATGTTGAATIGGSGCGDDISHATVQITGSAGAVGVTGLRQQGAVTLTGNTAGVTLSGASIAGTVTVSSNEGSAAVVIKGNAVTGSLMCASNSPAPGDAGKTNTVSATATGQCAKLVPTGPGLKASPPLDQDLSATLPTLGYGQAVGHFDGAGTEDQLAYFSTQDNTLTLKISSEPSGAVLRSVPTDLDLLPDYSLTQDFPWDTQTNLVEGWAVAASASNIYVAGETFDCADCGSTQLHLYKLPHDGSCAQASCAVQTVSIPGVTSGGHQMLVSSLAVGVVGGRTIIAMGVAQEGILLYDDNLHLITTLADWPGSQDQPSEFSTAPTALAFGPASGSGEGGQLVAAIANANDQTLLHPFAGWDLKPDGTEQDFWQYAGGPSWDPKWIDLGAAVTQADGEPAAAFTRSDGDVLIVSGDGSSLITELPASERTGMPVGLTSVAPWDDGQGNPDLVVGMASGTGDKVLQEVDGTLTGVPIAPGGATTGTNNQVYAWFPGYRGGRLTVTNSGGDGPVNVAMSSRPDPGYGCWLNAAVTQSQVPAFPTSDTQVDSSSGPYFIGALTAGATGDCASGQGKGEHAAYVIITPVNNQTDEHIVKLLAGPGNTVRIASQVGGDLTAKLSQGTGTDGSWGSWTLAVQQPAAPAGLQQAAFLQATMLTSLPATGYAAPSSPQADDPCRPVFRFQLTDSYWDGVQATGRTTAQIPAMVVQGSPDTKTWTDLGLLMPSTEPTFTSDGRLELGVTSFYWQDPPGTASLPTMPAVCPRTGRPPTEVVRVLVDGQASYGVQLAGVVQDAPPIGGGAGATSIQGMTVTPEGAGAIAAPRANGVDQAALDVQLQPSDTGGVAPPTDPQYNLVYYRYQTTNNLVTGLYDPSDYSDYVAVGPYAANGASQGTTIKNYLVTTSTATQNLEGVVNDTGTITAAGIGKFTVNATDNPLVLSGNATSGVQVSGCLTVNTYCGLTAPSATKPLLYQAGGQDTGPVLGLQFADAATTGRASLPLQVGTGNAHNLGSAPLVIRSNRAVLQDTSPFWPQDTLDTALVAQGDLVSAPSITVGGNG